MKAVWNSIEYDIVSPLPSIKRSSRELSFSTLVVDFTDKDIDDLPLKMQEIIIQEDGVTMFFGYCNGYKLPKINGTEQVIFLEIDLLSPQKIATMRSKTIRSVSTALNTVVESVLSPLLEEGFTIETNTLSDKIISVQEAFKPVEQIMNKLSNNYDFYWYIDEMKKIYLLSKDSVTGIKPLFNDLTSIDFAGVTYQPKMEAVGYSNVVNGVNQKILDFRDSLIAEDVVIGPQETVFFQFPISYSRLTGARLQTQSEALSGGSGEEGGNFLTLNITRGGFAFFYTLSYNPTTDEVTFGSGLGIDGEDNETEDLLLVPDTTIEKVLVGLKNNLTVDIIVNRAASSSALINTITVYQDVGGIEASKDKISITGRVEETINFNGRFLTKLDSLEFAKNRVLRSGEQNNTSEVQIDFKGLTNTQFETFINDARPLTTIKLNEDFAKGTFIITDTNYKNDKGMITFTIEAKNTNLIENYLDIFRKNEEEATEEEINNQIYSFLVKEEEITETKLTLVDGVIIDEN